MNRVGIIGAGDLGVTVSQHLKSQDDCEQLYFFDDTKITGALINGIEIKGKIDDAYKYLGSEINKVIICIGYTNLVFRNKLFQDFSKAGGIYTFVHKSVVMGEGVKVSDGAIIFPGCVLDNGVIVGENTLLNTGVVIAHDTSIGASTFISPGVNIAGFVKIGSRCFIGMGSNIIDNVNIVDDVFLAGASLVLKDITKSGRYVRRVNELQNF